METIATMVARNDGEYYLNESTSMKGDTKQLLYADVLTELKKKSIERGSTDNTLPLKLSLAPMSSCLQKTPPKESYNESRKKAFNQYVLSPNAIRIRTEKSLQESKKRLKAIEDHMWLHRQEERDLRRAENDITRQQKHMESSLKQYENKISKQKNDEANVLLEHETKYTTNRQRDLHTREYLTKDKIQNAHLMRQKINECTKKFMKSNNEMCRRYQNLVELLEQKRNEMELMGKEFEARVREKEEEQHQMKQELASLAIGLNMESQRKRKEHVDTQRNTKRTGIKELNDNLLHRDELKKEDKMKHTAETRHENQHKELEQTLQNKTKLVKSKERQEGRNLIDVKTKLHYTAESRRQLEQEMEHIHLSILNETMKERVAMATAKRHGNLKAFQKQTKERNNEEMKDWSKRALSKETENRLREHQERLQRLSKLVTHYDNIEHTLFSQARQADSLIKKQQLTIAKLQNELNNLKKANAKKLKEISVNAERAEQELHQKILRETGELSKIMNTRQEMSRSLNTQRSRNKEDREFFMTEKKEHDRRIRIADRKELKSSLKNT